jgi:hypothetical protein
VIRARRKRNGFAQTSLRTRPTAPSRSGTILSLPRGQLTGTHPGRGHSGMISTRKERTWSSARTSTTTNSSRRKRRQVSRTPGSGSENSSSGQAGRVITLTTSRSAPIARSAITRPTE